jgi:hypothetical protein
MIKKMVRKTQIKQKKSKSQLHKTLKHYSKTNKNKKGGWSRKSSSRKSNKTMSPPTNNRFANRTGVKQNPLFKNNNNNNSKLPNGFVRNHVLNHELYSNSNLGFVYNNSNSQSMPSGVYNGNNEYVSIGSQTYTNPNYNPVYTPMNPIYNNVGVPGEAKLRRNLNNGNLLNGTAKA